VDRPSFAKAGDMDKAQRGSHAVGASGEWNELLNYWENNLTR